MPPRGRAGFFCQSGALGSAILEKVQNRGLGLSTFVSAGNRAEQLQIIFSDEYDANWKRPGLRT